MTGPDTSPMARKIIGEVREIEKTHMSGLYVAMVYLPLAITDNAFVELANSFRDRDCVMPRARVDPSWSLRMMCASEFAEADGLELSSLA